MREPEAVWCSRRKKRRRLKREQWDCERHGGKTDIRKWMKERSVNLLQPQGDSRVCGLREQREIACVTEMWMVNIRLREPVWRKEG